MFTTLKDEIINFLDVYQCRVQKLMKRDHCIIVNVHSPKSMHLFKILNEWIL